MKNLILIATLLLMANSAFADISGTDWGKVEDNVENGSTDALAKIQNAANAGDAGAQYNLGILYAYSLNRLVRKDYAQAALWFRKAADQGNANAQASLGFLYSQGQGVEKDYANAALWYRKAADQGNANALVQLDHIEKEQAREDLKKEQTQEDLKKEQAQEEKANQLYAEQQIEKVKQIGQFVCKTIHGTESYVVGTTRGKNNYSSPEDRIYEVGGYTEGVSGDKVKIRINGIRGFDRFMNPVGNIDHVDGAVVYAVGQLVWDDVINWKTNCDN